VGGAAKLLPAGREMIDIIASISDTGRTKGFQSMLRRLGERREFSACRVVIQPSFEALAVQAREQTVSAVLLDPSVLPRRPRNERRAAEPDDAVPRALAEWLRSKDRPPTAIWADADWLHPRRVLRLATMGLSEVVVRGREDTLNGVCTVVERLVNSERKAAFIRALSDEIPSDLEGLIQSLLVPTSKFPSPEAMARRMYCDRATLYRRFRRAALPPPADLISWIRIYLVLSLVDEGTSLEDAVSRLGFQSKAAFWSMTARRIPEVRREEIMSRGRWGVVGFLKATVQRLEGGPRQTGLQQKRC
jgi:AraC-like DNA-binding protein